MKALIDFLEEHHYTVAALASLLVFAFKRVRLVAMGVLRWFREVSAGPASQRRILEMLEEMKTHLEATGTAVAEVQKEVKFNGGKSLRDMIFLLFCYRRHDFWRSRAPLIEFDANGNVLMISEGSVLLFGVTTPEDLMRRSWLRYIDSDDVTALITALVETIGFNSEFRYQATIRGGQVHPGLRGVWELRAGPITHDGSSNRVYSGEFFPVDEEAMEVHRELRNAA